MTTKNIQLFRKNLDTSETNLYPLTEAQYVSMENGQTVQEILSDRDSDKYTPVITNSSSTFKVGQGDNVDLSSSMKEGAYDSCVLKGKTMVNCIQEPSSKDVVLPYEFADGRYVTINDTKESGALGVELKGQTLVNLAKVRTATAYNRCSEKNIAIKPNTKYIALFNPTYYEAENGVNYALLLVSSVSLNDSVVGGDDAYTKSVSEGRGSEYKPRKGDRHLIFTSKANETYLHIRTGGNNGILYTDMIVLEYQEGMEDWDIPYFTGMTSCKMPTLHTVGKNLITQSFINTVCNLDNWEGTGAYRNNRKAGELLALFPSNSYVTQVPALTIPANFYPIIYLSYQDESSVSNGHILASGLYNNNTDSEMVCPERQWRFSVNSKNVVVRGYVNKWNQENMNKLKTVMTQNIQMETGTTTTTYEQGKSSILSLPEEVVLRSLPNGVCDTFNTRTGVYTQRVGAMVLNGSDPITSRVKQVDNVLTTTSRCYLDYASIPSDISMKPFSSANRVSDKLICDILPVKAVVPDMQQDDIESVGQTTAGFSIRVKGKTVAECRQRLAEQPIVIQYELATPVITKINLPSTLKSWNTTTHIYSEIPENTLYPTLSHVNPSYPAILKPSTKYSIVANSYSNSHANSAINFNLGGATATTTVGNRVTTITTPSTLSNELLTMSGRGNKLSNVMVIEGDVVGDEPYFEGICDCKSPILSNVGKNLFTTNNMRTGNIAGNGSSIEGNDIGGNWQVTDYIPVKPLIEYYHSTSLYKFEKASFYDINKKIIYGTGVNNFKTRVISTPHQCAYVRYVVMKDSSTNNSLSLEELVSNNDIVVTQGGSNIAYEPYKSNTTTFNQKDDKTIVLRSLPNGVCDTLNVETGEYVQRIGDYTVNGTETSWFTYIDTTGVNNNYLNQTSCAFGVHLTGKAKGNGILCDKLPTRSIGWWGGNHTGEGICGIDNDNRIFLRVKNEKTGVLYTDNTSTALEKVKTYLASNPVTVQYELATPIVSTIDVQGFPYAYTSGHVQLSSGHSGQSLTPTVEYSLPANKTGQIDSNTRQVVRQQKQLDDFEAMMLTSLVQSAYDKAILQFDYEMQMMSLGGE